MRRTVGVLALVMMMATGCVTQKAHYTAATVTGILATGFGAAAGWNRCHGQFDSCGALDSLMVTNAILFGTIALVSLATAPTDQEEADRTADERANQLGTPEEMTAAAERRSHVFTPEPPTRDARLRQLTLQASVAARRGDCRVVEIAASQVDVIDPAYRAAGFLSDPPVAACLAPQ